jgi:hypothetical protein
MRRREALQIGRAAPGKMRAGDPEMVEKLGQAGRDRSLRVAFRLSWPCFPSFLQRDAGV